MGKKTDIKKIVEYLDPLGRKITNYKANRKWGMLNFNSRISDIRKMCRSGKLERVLLTNRVKTEKGVSIAEHSFA